MINNQLHLLQNALQILALPVTFQMSLEVGDSCRVHALCRPFVRWQQTTFPEVIGELTIEQTDVLANLNTLLTRMPPLPDCADLTLRINPNWQRIRRMARVTLLAFGWTLDLPPDKAMAYQLIKGGQTHDQFSSI